MAKSIGIIVALLTLIVLKSGLFIVDEGTQGIVTEFGKPIGNPKTQAGIYWKTPFIQQVQYVDKRILSWDGYPNEIPTKDKKYISVDTTARWRIVEPLKFIISLRNESVAKSKLDSILDGHTRDTISNYNLVEAVRNTNNIFDRIQQFKANQILAEEKALVTDEEADFSSVEKITSGREKLSQIIAEKAGKELETYGIKLIDVQLRRISYDASVEQKVYDRMVSERQRIAEKIRSIGKGEQAKIQGTLNKDLQRIQSEAYKISQEIRGKAEAKATAIYARSLRQDPAFYEFVKSMEVYKDTFREDTKLILSSKSQFLRFLKQQQ